MTRRKCQLFALTVTFTVLTVASVVLASRSLATPQLQALSDPGWITIFTDPANQPVSIAIHIDAADRVTIKPFLPEGLDQRANKVKLAVALTGSVRLKSVEPDQSVSETDPGCGDDGVLLGRCSEDGKAQVFVFEPSPEDEPYGAVIGTPMLRHVSEAAGTLRIVSPFVRAMRPQVVRSSSGSTRTYSRIDLQDFEVTNNDDAFGAPDPSRTALMMVGPTDGTAIGTELESGEGRALELQSAEPPLDIPAMRAWGSCVIVPEACETVVTVNPFILASTMTLVDSAERRRTQWELFLAGAFAGVAGNALIAGVLLLRRSKQNTATAQNWSQAAELPSVDAAAAETEVVDGELADTSEAGTQPIDGGSGDSLAE
jgi:hypothetical protein